FYISSDASYIEFSRDVFEDLTDKFFEVAFKFHGKYDSIKEWLKKIKNDVDDFTKKGNIGSITSKLRIDNPNEEKVCKVLAEEIGKRWKGVAYESFYKIKKSELDGIDKILKIINDLLRTLDEKRDFFVEKEVQTF